MITPNRRMPFPLYFQTSIEYYAKDMGVEKANDVLAGLARIARGWGCNGDLCTALLNEYVARAEKSRITPHEVLFHSLVEVRGKFVRVREPVQVLRVYIEQIQLRKSLKNSKDHQTS